MEQQRKLEERCLNFSCDLIASLRKMHEDTLTKPIINQLLRSGTSIGANYNEANNASSSKDFKNKIYICKKECQETQYWLKILKNCYPAVENIDKLLDESRQLSLIFQKIVTTLKSKENSIND